MKFRITQEHLKNITKIGLFACVVAIIIKLYPSEKHFKYNFEIGKPWKYELVTASFDFPIYKDPAQIQQEKDEILKNYTPFFYIDNHIGAKQVQELILKNKQQNILTQNNLNYLIKRINEIYGTGILSIEQYNNLIAEKRERISVIDEKRVTHTIDITDLYTPKTAYENILENAPFGSEDNIKNIKLNYFLESNLTFDSITSAVTQQELLKNLSQTSGIIQTGERIIDKGEIVSKETYQILKSLKIATEQKQDQIEQSVLVIIGKVLIVSLFIVLLALYFYLFRPRIFENFSNLLFIALLIILMALLVSITLRYTELSIYIVPFAWLPVIIRVFFDSRTALFAHLVSTMIISFMVPNPFEFVILQTAIGMTAVSTLKDMTQRAQLAQTALWVFLTYIVGYIAFMLISEGAIAQIPWQPFLYFALSSLILLFAYGLIYIFEKIFGLVSSITLVELTNVNSDLMMRFAETAPGTFQHSLQVSNLATEAAKKINANSLLVRTGALYHDIGKMKNPQMFTENQQGGKNPLLEMDLEAAVAVIIGHVEEGVRIARKKGLPDTIINFIQTHHGNSKVRYFYNTFVNKNPGVTPNEAAFCYPGPLPNTKETAILMMADAVEACSRSLKEYTEESIDKMVENMINMQISDGMFKDTPITFHDVEIVKSVFKEKIKNIFHHRITYPEIKKQAENNVTGDAENQ